MILFERERMNSYCRLIKRVDYWQQSIVFLQEISVKNRFTTLKILNWHMPRLDCSLGGIMRASSSSSRGKYLKITHEKRKGRKKVAQHHDWPNFPTFCLTVKRYLILKVEVKKFSSPTNGLYLMTRHQICTTVHSEILCVNCKNFLKQHRWNVEWDINIIYKRGQYDTIELHILLERLA